MFDEGEVLADNGKTIRMWMFKDAPKILKNLSEYPEDAAFVLVIPNDIADGWEDEDSQYASLYEWVYRSYVKPEIRVFGNYTIYITYY